MECLSTGTRPSTWIEMHTNDKKQARTWSELFNQRGSEFRKLVSERETEEYFEFNQVNPDHANNIFLSRVHKSSYFIPALDWTTFDYFSELTQKEIGILKQRPITVTAAKNFIEYYWSSTVFKSDKVLETKVVELPNWFQYNLKSARLYPGDIGLYDEVEITEYDFFVHKRMGDVYFSTRKIKDLKGNCR